MILNIISKSASDKRIGGPIKVIKNTLLGLDLIEQEYVLNQPIEKCEWNWIQDSVDVFIEAAVKKIPAVVDPNLFVTPEEIPVSSSLEHLIYLHPAQWTKDIWIGQGFDKCRIEIWQAGIDLKSFQMSERINNKNVLLYFKKRDPELKKITIKILERLKYKVNLIEYGFYNEEQFKQALKDSYFGVWIGTTESQGIALQESLASGLPLIVLDSKNVLDNTSIETTDLPAYLSKYEATSIPYFDQRCGIVINEMAELGKAVEKLFSDYTSFDPAAYIKENLSLESSARKLVSFFNELDQLNTTNTETKNKLVDHLKYLSAYNSYRFKKNINRVKRRLKKL